MEPRVPFAASCDPTTAALLAHTFTLAPVMITADEGQGVAKAMAVVYGCRVPSRRRASVLTMERSCSGAQEGSGRVVVQGMTRATDR